MVKSVAGQERRIGNSLATRRGGRISMIVGQSVRHAIDDWGQRKLESAMLHACNAVDGTAAKLYPARGNKERFTRTLRENYEILGPMGAPGIDLVQTRFPVTIKGPTAPDGKPDLADVLYGIHRCVHAHGDELPDGFELLPDAAGPKRLTHIEIARGKVRLSDRMIFGLLAVAVFSPVNRDQAIKELDGYFLTYGESPKLVINKWWGRTNDFPAIVAQDPPPGPVKLDFGNWGAP
jgi:hypothetical protein